MKTNRCPVTGQFIKRSSVDIVSGRLYGYKGIPVRATSITQTDLKNHLRLRKVVAHKTLEGFVPESELQIISKAAVGKYLAKA